MTAEYISPRYISVADTAKLVRAALKTSFPSTKFSVRSKSYSMGASITVDWTDGPTRDQVDAVVKRFEGAHFDGMEDLKSYQDDEMDGERVHYASDYVIAQRKESVNLVTKVAQAYCTWNHDEMPEVIDSYGNAYVECKHWIDDDIGTCIMSLVRDCAEDELEGVQICIYRGRIRVKHADMPDDEVTL